MTSVFEEIPGVGTSLANDFESLGYHVIDNLRGQDPEMMYEKVRDRASGTMGRCVSYSSD